MNPIFILEPRLKKAYIDVIRLWSTLKNNSSITWSISTPFQNGPKVDRPRLKWSKSKVDLDFWVRGLI